MTSATRTLAPMTEPSPTMRPLRNENHMNLNGLFRILTNSSFLSFLTCFVSSVTSFISSFSACVFVLGGIVVVLFVGGII